MSDDLCTHTIAHQMPSTFLNEDIFAHVQLSEAPDMIILVSWRVTIYKPRSQWNQLGFFCFKKKNCSLPLSHVMKLHTRNNKSF